MGDKALSMDDTMEDGLSNGLTVCQSIFLQ